MEVLRLNVFYFYYQLEMSVQLWHNTYGVFKHRFQIPKEILCGLLQSLIN